MVDIGPGSPTGVVSGEGAKFPARYQHAIFANDWTYGTMYAIHLTPEGSSYKAEKEEFVSGRPLPLTDMLIHPKDGAMYFAIGGRGTQSAVYRVTYTGSESTAAVKSLKENSAHKLRRELETLHNDGTGQEAIAKAWPHLSSDDRWIRYAARVAIERQPVSAWADRVFGEKRPWAVIEGAVAVARIGKPEHRDRLLGLLNGLNFAKLDEAGRLAAIRAYPGLSNARRVTFEYVMLKGVNDSPAEARALVNLIKGIPAKVNLIPFNPWPGSPYECSGWGAIETFAAILNKAGYASPIRTPRGRDILAACGQLKSESEKVRASARRRSPSGSSPGDAPPTAPN
jgi:hypothetical protein